MHMDPMMPILTSAVLAILLIGLIMRRLKQPYVVAYLIAGIIIGPHVMGLIEEPWVVSKIGSIGVLLLLFFIGMEISLPRLIADWRIAVFGTLLQIIITTCCIFVLGVWLEWPIARSILLGFVISLSSTSVIIKILQEWKEVDSDVGRNVIGILLVQDLAVIPMIITINFLGGAKPDTTEIILQVIGGMAIISLLVWVIIKGEFKLPFSSLLSKDHELQVFSALVLCFGLSFLTGIFNLSTALGAFVAGILISAAKETHWVHQRLEPFHVLFVALFFVSVGMLVDLKFLQENYLLILLLITLSFAMNTIINAGIMRVLGDSWQQSLYGGALLSQIGEFSFVLATVGVQSNIINQFGYQLVIAVITLTLVFSPAWILFVKRLNRT